MMVFLKSGLILILVPFFFTFAFSTNLTLYKDSDELIYGEPVRIYLTGFTDGFSKIDRPIDVFLLIDRSGSMNDVAFTYKSDDFILKRTKLDVAKSASKHFTFFLLNDDRVGLVSYGGNVLNHNLTFDDFNVRKSIDNLKGGGCTPMGDGLAKAIDEISATKRQEALTAIVLLADGQNNCGAKVPLEEAKRARIDNTLIYTIGVGSMIDESTMLEIARITGGKYYYSPKGKDLNDIYKSISKSIYDRLSNSTVLDVIPQFAEVLDSNGGTVQTVNIDGEQRKRITWNYGFISQNHSLNLSYVVRFLDYGFKKVSFENQSYVDFTDQNNTRKRAFFPLIGDLNGFGQIKFIDFSLDNLFGNINDLNQADITATIRNNGNATSKDTQVAFYADLMFTNKIGEVNTSSLRPMETQFATANINSEGLENKQIFALVNPYNATLELNYEDNWRSMTLIKDFDPPAINCNNIVRQTTNDLVFSPDVNDPEPSLGINSVRICSDAQCNNLICNYEPFKGESFCRTDSGCDFYTIDLWVSATDNAGFTTVAFCKDVQIKKTVGCECTFSEECYSGICKGSPSICQENPIPEIELN